MRVRPGGGENVMVIVTADAARDQALPVNDVVRYHTASGPQVPLLR